MAACLCVNMIGGLKAIVGPIGRTMAARMRSIELRILIGVLLLLDRKLGGKLNGRVAASDCGWRPSGGSATKDEDACM